MRFFLRKKTKQAVFGTEKWRVMFSRRLLERHGPGKKRADFLIIEGTNVRGIRTAHACVSGEKISCQKDLEGSQACDVWNVLFAASSINIVNVVIIITKDTHHHHHQSSSSSQKTHHHHYQEMVNGVFSCFDQELTVFLPSSGIESNPQDRVKRFTHL